MLLVNGEPQGPFAFSEIQEQLRRGFIQSSTMAWHEGIETWVEVSKILKSGGTPVSGQPSDSSKSSTQAPLRVPKPPEETPWFYLVRDETCGPISSADLKRRLTSRLLPPTTYVTKQGMASWQKANTIKDFECECSSADQASPEPPELNSQTNPPRSSQEHSAPEGPSTAKAPVLQSATPVSAAKNEVPSRWWPSSRIGSCILAGAVAYKSLSVIWPLCGVYVCDSTARSLQWDFTLQSARALGLVVGLYFLFVLMRYLIVVVPKRRKLLRQGFSGDEVKIGPIDYVLNSAITFVASAIVMSAVYAFHFVTNDTQPFESALQEAKAQLATMTDEARGYQSSLEANETERNRLAQTATEFNNYISQNRNSMGLEYEPVAMDGSVITMAEALQRMKDRADVVAAKRKEAGDKVQYFFKALEQGKFDVYRATLGLQMVASVRRVTLTLAGICLAAAVMLYIQARREKIA